MSTTTKEPPVGFMDKSHPEHRADATEELVQLASNIRAYQERTSPRLSDEAMVKRFPGLGSTKTYRRIHKGDTSSLDLDKQLTFYRGVWRQIEETTGADGREEIYPDLTPAFEVQMAAAGLLGQRGNERIVIVEGPTGAGKSKSLDLLASTYPGQSVRLEATEAWSSANVMLGDVLIGLGCYKDTEDDRKRMPAGVGGRLREVIAELNKARRMLLIDEGHHMVAAGLNLLKSITNQTESLIVLACIDTLWGKLAAKSWREASQLIFNRLYERVRLAPPSAEDVEMFLERRVASLNGGDWKKACGKLAACAANAGSFAFLRRVAAKSNAMSHEPTAGDLLEIAANLNQALKTR